MTLQELKEKTIIINSKAAKVPISHLYNDEYLLNEFLYSDDLDEEEIFNTIKDDILESGDVYNIIDFDITIK